MLLSIYGLAGLFAIDAKALLPFLLSSCVLAIVPVDE